jgi:hypothetical protein
MCSGELGVCEAKKEKQAAVTMSIFTLNDSLDNMFSEFNSDLARLDSEAEAILNSIRNEKGERSESESSTLNDQSDNDCDSQDGSDLHDDDELTDELLRLGSVVASIQQDMEKMSVNPEISQISALSAAEHTPSKTNPPEVKSSQSKRVTGGQKASMLLLLSASLIWALVIILGLHVNNLNGKGGLDFFPASPQHRVVFDKGSNKISIAPSDADCQAKIEADLVL